MDAIMQKQAGEKVVDAAMSFVKSSWEKGVEDMAASEYPVSTMEDIDSQYMLASSQPSPRSNMWSSVDIGCQQDFSESEDDVTEGKPDLSAAVLNGFQKKGSVEADGTDGEPNLDSPATFWNVLDKQDRVCWADASLDCSAPSSPRASSSINDPAGSTPAASAPAPAADANVKGAAERSRAASKTAALSEDSHVLGGATTVMLKNVPFKYTQRIFLKELNSSGFLGHYDFVYFPLGPGTELGLGFAFINFDSAETARRFYDKFHKRKLTKADSDDVEVRRADVQGFYDNAKHHLSLEAVRQAESQSGRPRRNRKSQNKPLFLRPLPADLEEMYCVDETKNKDEDAEAAEPKAPVAQEEAPTVAKYCPFCGKAREADHAFCAYCGRQFPNGSPSSSSNLLAAKQPAQQPTMSAFHPVMAMPMMPAAHPMAAIPPMPMCCVYPMPYMVPGGPALCGYRGYPMPHA